MATRDFDETNAMEAFLLSVEADLHSLSAEARKSETLAGQLAGWLVNSEHPEVKVAAERAILKLRALSRQTMTKEVLRNSKELLRPFLLACETKSAKLTVLALACVQKLLANNAVSEQGVSAVITTLQHVERSGDEAVKLKTLQIILTLVQDVSFKSTVVGRPKLVVRLDGDVLKEGFASVLGVCFRILAQSRNTDTVLNTAAATIRQVVAVVFQHVTVNSDVQSKNNSTNSVALLLIDDLCNLAANSPALWIQSPTVSQHFSLELIEFVIATKPAVFHMVVEFETALRERVCHVLQNLITEIFELEAEPTKTIGTYRYVFKVLSTLLSKFYALIPGKIAQIWHPLCAGASSNSQIWRQLLCLQVLKICISDPAELYYLYEMFDMARDFDILAVSRVVDVTVKLLNSRNRSTGGEENRRSMISMEEKLQTPSSPSAEEVPDEATVDLAALEILLKIANAIHQLSEECVEVTEIEESQQKTVCLKHVARSMLDRFADPLHTTFEAHLSSKICGESIILIILKGYQDILRAAANFELTDVGEKFLTSLCECSAMPSQENGSGNEPLTLTSLNLHSARTLLNVVQQLGNVLGPSWIVVVRTLYSLDGILRNTMRNRESRSIDSGMESDVEILEISLRHLFDGTAALSTDAVTCLLSSLRDVSLQIIISPTAKNARPSFCLQHMVDVLLKNLSRVHDLWGLFLAHVIEMIGTNETTSWTVAIEGLDRAVIGILDESFKSDNRSSIGDQGAIENMLLVALESLFTNSSYPPIRVGILRISFHVLQRSGEELTRGWEPLLRLLQNAPDVPDIEIVSVAFDSVELLVNEYLNQLEPEIQARCLRIVTSFAKQTIAMNVSLTAINLLWSAVDMFGKEAKPTPLAAQLSISATLIRWNSGGETETPKDEPVNTLFYLINVLQQLSLDKRPEVRNSGIRSFFAALVSYGSKFCNEEWSKCVNDVLLPLVKSVYYISMTSSSDEAKSVELGKEKGRSVMMLMHYSRNTERKQWEETMVLALNGVCKILRLYLPLLVSLHNFAQAYEQIAVICKNSMVKGSKEAAMAAIALIVQVSETFGSSTTQLPTQTMTSILRSMEESMELVTNHESHTPATVRCELVKAIGLIAKSTKHVLPESTMRTFIQWLQKLACKPVNADEAAQNIQDMLPMTQKEMLVVISSMSQDSSDALWVTVVGALCSFLYPVGIDFEPSLAIPPPVPEEYNIGEESFSSLWLTHIVEQLEKIFLTRISKDIQKQVFSQVLASVGRCMTSRFVDTSEGSSLWIKATTLFRSVLDVGIAAMPEDSRSGHQWMRDWETIATIFEAAFNGKHLHISTDVSPDPFATSAASELKLSILDTLTDLVMSSYARMSDSTLRRLVTLIDSTISLHGEEADNDSPSGNLCHSCLRKLFVLCSQSNDSSVATVALPLFVHRCKKILSVFSTSETESGGVHLSLVRVGEVVFALEMLSTLRVAPSVAEAVLAEQSLCQKTALARSYSGGSARRPSTWITSTRRPHLLMIYDTLCNCIMSKEALVRELAMELLKSVGNDMGLM